MGCSASARKSAPLADQLGAEGAADGQRKPFAVRELIAEHLRFGFLLLEDGLAAAGRATGSLLEQRKAASRWCSPSCPQSSSDELLVWFRGRPTERVDVLPGPAQRLVRHLLQVFRTPGHLTLSTVLFRARDRTAPSRAVASGRQETRPRRSACCQVSASRWFEPEGRIRPPAERSRAAWLEGLSSTTSGTP